MTLGGRMIPSGVDSRANARSVNDVPDNGLNFLGFLQKC